MAKDKRSRRDKLKDGMLDKFRDDINEIVALNKSRVLKIEDIEKDIDRDALMIKVLEEQIENIDAMCTKQDESYKAKKPDDKAT